MEYHQFGTKIVLRLDKGEQLVTSIKQLCREQGIKLATVSGIGAVNRVDVGIFLQQTHEYHTKESFGSMEITSLSGNISQRNHEVYTHLHITLTGEDYNAFGGHLNEAWVGATCELIIDVINGEIEREFSSEIGLNLLKYPTDAQRG